MPDSVEELIDDHEADPLPQRAQYDHCILVYKAMDKDAVVKDGDRIWYGFTTKLFRELELPTPYYTTVLRLLRNMACIQQLRRGGGQSMSAWTLIRPPTDELYRSVLRTAPKTSSHKRNIQLQQGQRDLNVRVDRLERQVVVLLDALGLLGDGEPTESVGFFEVSDG